MPTTSPVPVTDSTTLLSAALVCARPKSVTTARTPSGLSFDGTSTTLLGLKSRWTMPAWCAARERRGHLPHERQRLGRLHPAGRRSRCASVSPGSSSIVRKTIGRSDGDG